MAVKSEVIEKEELKSKKKNPYPCIKKVVNGTLVVLFTGPEKGFVLVGDNNYNNIGSYSMNWAESSFKLIEYPILLVNE